MEEKLRHPQTINGETFPRHHYLGLESVRKLKDLVNYLENRGVDILSIPLINEVEAGMLAQDFDKGELLGLAAPILGNDLELMQVLVWDGQGVAAISVMMYLHKVANGWKIPGEEGYEKPDFGYYDSAPAEPATEQPQPKKKKQTTPKHTRRRQAKDRFNKRKASRF